MVLLSSSPLSSSSFLSSFVRFCAANAVVTSLLISSESAVMAATVAAGVVAMTLPSWLAASPILGSHHRPIAEKLMTPNRRNGFRTVPPDLCMSSMYFGMSSLVTVSIAVNIPSSFTGVSALFNRKMEESWCSDLNFYLVADEASRPLRRRHRRRHLQSRQQDDALLVIRALPRRWSSRYIRHRNIITCLFSNTYFSRPSSRFPRLEASCFQIGR